VKIQNISASERDLFSAFGSDLKKKNSCRFVLCENQLLCMCTQV